MPRQENPEVFKSSRFCVQEHKEELTAPGREEKPGQGVQEDAEVSPRSSSGAGDGWDVTALSPPSCCCWKSGMALQEENLLPELGRRHSTSCSQHRWQKDWEE